MVNKADDGANSTRKQEGWDEPEAVRLLQHAGELVTVFENSGARTPPRELYHARLIAAHDARDMTAYQMALNGYVEAAREASKRAERHATYQRKLQRRG
jgi:hypothetical protein